jgi:hypothetical protein
MRRRGVVRTRTNAARRGGAYVEYLIVVALTGCAVLIAVRALGPELAARYSLQRNALYRAFP